MKFCKSEALLWEHSISSLGTFLILLISSALTAYKGKNRNLTCRQEGELQTTYIKKSLGVLAHIPAFNTPFASSRANFYTPSGVPELKKKKKKKDISRH